LKKGLLRISGKEGKGRCRIHLFWEKVRNEGDLGYGERGKEGEGGSWSEGKRFLAPPRLFKEKKRTYYLFMTGKNEKSGRPRRGKEKKSASDLFVGEKAAGPRSKKEHASPSSGLEKWRCSSLHGKKKRPAFNQTCGRRDPRPRTPSKGKDCERGGGGESVGKDKSSS